MKHIIFVYLAISSLTTSMYAMENTKPAHEIKDGEDPTTCHESQENSVVQSVRTITNLNPAQLLATKKIFEANKQPANQRYGNPGSPTIGYFIRDDSWHSCCH